MSDNIAVISLPFT